MSRPRPPLLADLARLIARYNALEEVRVAAERLREGGWTDLTGYDDFDNLCIALDKAKDSQETEWPSM